MFDLFNSCYFLNICGVHQTEVAKVVETQTNVERQLELIETHQQEVYLRSLVL